MEHVDYYGTSPHKRCPFAHSKPTAIPCLREPVISTAERDNSRRSAFLSHGPEPGAPSAAPRLPCAHVPQTLFSARRCVLACASPDADL